MGKFVEHNLPEKYHLQVCHLHSGNTSANQRKHIGRTNAKYVTIARIWDGDKMVSEGVAACSPKDNPRRDIGRAVAVGRAIAEAYYMGELDYE